MNYRSHIHVFLATFLICFCACDRTRDSRTDAKNRELRAASALFERFETVAFSKTGLLPLPGSRVHNRLPREVSGPLGLPFYLLLEGLNSLSSQAKSEVLENAHAVLVGAKEFRPPAGLGPVRSLRCYVIILNDHRELDMRKYFRQEAVSSVAGVLVWNWSAELGEFGEDDKTASSFYAAHLGGSFLLVSNNLRELQGLTERLVSSNVDIQMLAEIRDWEIMRQQEAWAYRRYRHTEVLNRVAAGMDGVTPGARALAFLLDTKKKVFTLRLFSAPGDDGTAASITATGFFGRLRWSMRGGDTVWERTFPVEGEHETPEDTRGRLSVLMAMLGFGVYV